MPLSRALVLLFGRTLLALLAVLFFARGAVAPAYAVEESEPVQASGDREVWDRQKNRVELFGHAVVREPGETLQADHIILDQNVHTLDAHGNAIYMTEQAVIYGDEMHFNLETRTGTVVNGRVSTDRFSLAGERINKLGENHFQTHWGEYTTCRDCPASWSFRAKDVDMTIEGYAYMDDVRLKVDDTAAIWLPYLVLPMKSRRQTGFLFPRYLLSSQDGFVFVESFFWAISRSVDMTLGLGTYTGRGLRGEWEGRYALSERSKGMATFDYINDKTLNSNQGDGIYNPSGNTNRYGFDIQQTQELPWNLEEKLRVTEVSDNLYPFRFNDFSEVIRDAYLPSSFNLNYTDSFITANAGVHDYRDLLYLGPDFRTFDPNTVQAIPTVDMTTNDRNLFGTGFFGGISLGMTNFTRAAGGYDSAYQIQNAYDPTDNPPLPASPAFRPGIDPLRKATRFSMSPRLYTTVQPIEGVSLIPSVQYNSFYYFFRDAPGVSPLYQAYPLMQVDLSTQIEKVYDMDNPDVPKRKHLIRPILTYSNIPVIQRPGDHPFIQQINYAAQHLGGSFVGFNFDDQDIVPRDNSTTTSTNYFTPLGNSISYGFLTQLIDRLGPVDQENVTYRVPLELSVAQTFNFREYMDDAGSPAPFSRIEAELKTNYLDKITTDSTYYYYPYTAGIHQEVISSISYILERAYHQRILNFDRSFSLGYTWDQVGYTGFNSPDQSATNQGTHQVSAVVNWSISDYLQPSASATYNLISHQLSSWAYSLAFRSPSQCWMITTGLSFDPTFGHVFSAPSFSLNLTGTGFDGMAAH